jgi:hypothetical protein
VGVNPSALFVSQEAVPPGNIDITHWTFSGLANVGFLSNTAGNTWEQDLTGGTFTLWSSTNVALISGVFSDAKLDGTIDGVSSNYLLSFSGVNYNGGAWWTDAQNAGYTNPGAITLTLLSGVAANKSGAVGFQRFNPFTAHGSGNLDVTPPPAVPEPGSVVGFVVGALGLCVLALRARRSVRPVA